MDKLRSLDNLRQYQAYLVGGKNDGHPTIVIPAGTCGRASGGEDVIEAVRRRLNGGPGGAKVHVRVTGCHGFCQMEPSILVEPGGVFYPKVTPESAAVIVDATLKGAVVEDLLARDEATGAPVAQQAELPFFRHQVRTILSRHEQVEPDSISSYMADGGYSALHAVLSDGGPSAVLRQITESGLRGRGGAGFPTGKKWELLASQSGHEGKFLVCNADEGDPGAYMDRSVLEGNPHLILEGMLIGAFATGATEGLIYVRNEYPLAIEHVTLAIEQARELGLIGDNVLGSDFSFEMQIVRGAGAFVCGEETALIQSLEGRSGEPKQRPPFPIQSGIDGKPTAINNVETWANVPVVIEKGAEAYLQVGTEGNSGTKIFSLVGKIRNTGLVEVPMGISIRRIVEDIGGGALEHATIKAVQTGGPSGGCIPAADFGMAIDYDSLIQAGSIMGSGGMIVMDDTTCMVDIAKYFTRFLKDESCGKCFTCRKGTQRMYEILDDISRGRGGVAHLDLLRELAEAIKDTTMCGLGQTAPNPVLSTLKHFREEYLAHVEGGTCPAGVCKALVRYAITDACKGCRACVKVCPSDAIEGEAGRQHVIDAEKCVRCGACVDACKFEAVSVK